jgi:hypothetical protein
MDEKTTRAAGIDWAKDEHALCVLEEAGRKIFEDRFAHDQRGLAQLCGSLVDDGVLCAWPSSGPRGSSSSVCWRRGSW